MYIQVSEDFKKKSKSAIVAITIFVVVYILLFLFTLLVTIACVVGGIALIIAKPMFLTLMLGVGAIGTGVFIFFLSLNFYSKTHYRQKSSYGNHKIRRAGAFQND